MTYFEPTNLPEAVPGLALRRSAWVPSAKARPQAQGQAISPRTEGADGSPPPR